MNESARQALLRSIGVASALVGLRSMQERFGLLAPFRARTDEEEAEVWALDRDLRTAGAHPGWPVRPRRTLTPEQVTACLAALTDAPKGSTG